MLHPFVPPDPPPDPPSDRLDTAEILERTALEQAALIRRGTISSEELTAMYLEVIDRQNPWVSAFVDVLHEQALREARAFDKQRRRGVSTPFLGVPIGISDRNLARGSFTRFGSRAFERLFTPFDDATTAQLRRGGLVVIGKTATSELGAMPLTEPDIHPPTRNPWDLGVSPGGPSGGAGAALAAGMIPIAHGGDAAGSVRIPASFCHLFALKPSRGRVESADGRDDGDALASSGPLARSVEDAAAMLDVMAGITVGKPHWAPLPPAPFLELARRAPRPLQVRFTTRSARGETHPEVDAAVRAVAAALAALGHKVDEGDFVIDAERELLPVWQHLAAQAPVHDWALAQPVTRWLAEQGRHLPRDEAAHMVARTSRQVLAWFGAVDLWLTPTVPEPPPKIGAWRDLDPEEAFARASRLSVFTAPFNASGQPAASIPAGLTREGLPIGVQLVGRAMGDATVLAVCKQLEDALPFRGRRAPSIAMPRDAR